MTGDSTVAVCLALQKSSGNGTSREEMRKSLPRSRVPPKFLFLFFIWHLEEHSLPRRLLWHDLLQVDCVYRVALNCYGMGNYECGYGHNKRDTTLMAWVGKQRSTVILLCYLPHTPLQSTCTEFKVSAINISYMDQEISSPRFSIFFPSLLEGLCSPG